MRVVLKKRHSAGCWCWAPEATSWVINVRQPVMWLDRRGGGTGSTTMWIRLRCNDPDCEALAIVHHQDLMELVEKELA
ncbi:hypothetical protein PP298_08125 [Mycobacteroides abscessus]|uniref:hypothetical protein n=1 Tax=Mycobacteroides abscessus TaxID=36809 RepID=UPI000A56EDD7|nr:hypothetical protein [Mycobacteroides abscessus]MDM2015308.1 hypothetical protein [Mycobacteroides abscessus]MDM2019686.1 hypothetical protein [Mycobacteroides abscessus]MDM2025105.1 hypothetical protein [Mycobacteroides abscessus]MDM2027776.1 hypothetical protein [Mycobacteroides abscessus]MDM2034037.1 hypothetical protein [Mycobacteroides abscessus]